MPFVTPERRKYLDNDGEPIEPGDICYNFYKPMVEAWKAKPRWTTAHNIHKGMKIESQWLDDDDRTAFELAWEVFFQLYVMPYEISKRNENGDI